MSCCSHPQKGHHGGGKAENREEPHMSETVNLLAGEYKFDLPKCYCDFTAVEVFVIRHGDSLGVGDRLRILQRVRNKG